MTNDTGSSATRMTDALASAETFTRAQVADLLHRAFASEWPPELMWQRGYEAGYWARVAEENAAYPPEPHRVVTTAGQDAVAVHRRRERVDERYERPGDHLGGPVAVWEADRPDSDDLGPTAARWHSGVGVPVRKVGREWVWAS